MAKLQSETTTGRDIPRDETSSLIASDKVEGTAVYGLDGKKIGRIENLMIDKRSGKVAYAVLSFGGFLGIGKEHYPLPWSMLTYDENLGGYVTGLTKDQLEGAPTFNDESSYSWSTVDDYYSR
jgi:sporulation protein YlmC with PRC-barrel domain